MASPMIVQAMPQMQRVVRRPQHRFELRTRPWQIQPFMIAPVLPGETMKSLTFQSRTVTDPIKNKYVGWWNEYYFWYVKHRDLEAYLGIVDGTVLTDFQDMVLDPNWDSTASAFYDTSSNTLMYKGANSIDWVTHCLECVVQAYFRTQAEIGSTFSISAVPVASINQNSWVDSLKLTSAIAAIDVDLDAIGGGAGLLASEVEKGLRMYQLLRAGELTDMSYDDFLATYGQRSRKEVEHFPELIRYERDWQYPANTITQGTGAVSSAVSWAQSGKADKDRLFKEPGFIFGATICRPKVYLAKQTSAAVSLLNSAMTWLPAVMRDDPNTSVISVASGAGPIPLTDTAYTVDVRDLFMYGDQFMNYTPDTDSSVVQLPAEATAQKNFPVLADADALFVSGTPNFFVRQDGVVNLEIAGSVKDLNPQSVRAS